MLFGYSPRLVETQNTGVNMEAEIVAVYHGMSVNRSQKIRDVGIVASLKPCPHCRRKVRLSHKSETISLL